MKVLIDGHLRGNCEISEVVTTPHGNRRLLKIRFGVEFGFAFLSINAAPICQPKAPALRDAQKHSGGLLLAIFQNALNIPFAMQNSHH
ncbi:MAG TPA: hypothetical protein VNY05_13210 [Candidatus Acidoferrales bacterium]|jgi:hypothetical protein|nr:hypothetical protein [Candidatus Acidoferrales bacterium]